MKRYSILLIIVLGLAACNNGPIKIADYPEADAVYLTLEKTYTLNKDGSMEFTAFKEQQLLSHRAFHSLYGQTDIYYNPATDSVIVNLAETKTPDGKTVKVPENGYVDMIPGYANGAGTFSPLRHKAVVHTALERGSIIRSNYTILTKAGSWPNLAAHEMLTQECPVALFRLIVRVPKGEKLNYHAVNVDQEPVKSSKGGFDVYTWEVRDIGQTSVEPMGIRNNKDKAQIVFNSGDDFFTAFNTMTSQRAFTFETSIAMREKVSEITSALNDDFRKIGAIQKLVTDEIQTLPVPLKQTSYLIRPAIETYQSMAGTPEEKAVLLTALIRNLGMDAVPVAFVPEHLFLKDTLYEAVGPLDLIGFSHVEVNSPEGKLYLNATHTNLQDPIYQHNDDLIIPIEMGYSQVNMTPVSDADFQLAWDGTVRFDPTGSMLFGSFEGNFIGILNPFQGVKLFPEKVNQLYPGYGFIEVGSPRSTLISYERTFQDYFTKFGDKLMFDLPLNHSGFESLGLQFMAAERTSPVELPAKVREFQRLQITLPVGMHTVGFDRDVTLDNNLGRVSIRYNTQGSVVSVMRSLNINQVVIQPADYPQLKALLDPWLNPEYKTIILEKN